MNSVNNQLTLLKNENSLLEIHSIAQELKKLGVNEDNTYLFVKRHIIYDNVVLRFLKPLDKLLKDRKIQEFKTSTSDSSILANKIKQYKKQITPIEEALRLNTHYYTCFLMRKIEEDIKSYVASFNY